MKEISARNPSVNVKMGLLSFDLKKNSKFEVKNVSFFVFCTKKAYSILAMLLQVNKTQEKKNSEDFIKFFIKYLILFLRMIASTDYRNPMRA